MVDGCGHSEALVRTGCRIAEHRLANWTVVAFSEDTQVIDKQENSQSREIERAFEFNASIGRHDRNPLCTAACKNFI